MSASLRVFSTYNLHLGESEVKISYNPLLPAAPEYSHTKVPFKSIKPDHFQFSLY